MYKIPLQNDFPYRRSYALGRFGRTTIVGRRFDGGLLVVVVRRIGVFVLVADELPAGIHRPRAFRAAFRRTDDARRLDRFAGFHGFPTAPGAPQQRYVVHGRRERLVGGVMIAVGRQQFFLGIDTGQLATAHQRRPLVKEARLRMAVPGVAASRMFGRLAP